MFNLKKVDFLNNTVLNFYTASLFTSSMKWGFQLDRSPFFKSININGYIKLDNCLISTDFSIVNTAINRLRNIIIGQETGYFLELSLKGIGFKVFHFKSYLFLQLGFSHFYVYEIPSDLIIKAKRDRIIIFGVDNHLVGKTAYELYSLRTPDAYKAKGVQYKNKSYNLKEGKKK